MKSNNTIILSSVFKLWLRFPPQCIDYIHCSYIFPHFSLSVVDGTLKDFLHLLDHFLPGTIIDKGFSSSISSSGQSKFFLRYSFQYFFRYSFRFGSNLSLAFNAFFFGFNFLFHQVLWNPNYFTEYINFKDFLSNWNGMWPC